MRFREHLRERLNFQLSREREIVRLVERNLTVFSFFKKPAPQIKIAKDWRSEIEQSVAPAPTTPEARFKRWMQRLKKMALVLSVAFLVFLISFLAAKIGSDEFERAHYINNVQLITDGALTKEWALTYTGLNYSSTVMTKSVFEIKNLLLEYPQILSADVSRTDEDLLVITLKERRAVARVKLPNGEINMVAPDGVLFPAGTYFTANVDALPFVKDYELAEQESGIKVLQKYKELVAFLDAVRMINASFLVEWESVSLEHIPSKILSLRYNQPWAYFVVVPARGRTDAGLPPLAEINFSALRYVDELNLWCAPDTQATLKAYFAENPNAFLVPWKISFVLNTKDINNQFIEARIIPTKEIPNVAGTPVVEKSPATQERVPARETRPRSVPVLRRPVQQSRPVTSTQPARQPQRQRSDTPPNEVNPRYQRR